MSTQYHYIGDRVYARFDGCQIWIHAHNGFTQSQEIALEPGTMRHLIRYAIKHYGARVLTTNLKAQALLEVLQEDPSLGTFDPG